MRQGKLKAAFKSITLHPRKLSILTVMGGVIALDIVPNMAHTLYTLMDEDPGNVVAFNVVQVSEVSSSNAMEKEGFTRCIELLEGKGVNKCRVATDSHVSISSCMAKDYPHTCINHQYDVWHFSKWVVKKITNKAKQTRL